MYHGLIDGDLLVYRIGFSSNDIPERLCIFRLKSYFEGILDKLLLSDYTTFITSGDKSNYRYSISSTYKANRKAEKPLHYDLLRTELEENPFYRTNVIYNKEADDGIGIKASSFKSRKDYCIVSLDKDLIQIPGWHYNFVKEKKFYIPTQQSIKWFYKQLLIGDSADNIDGIIGIGENLANSLIDECSTEEEMYAVVYKIYKETNSLETLRERGRLLKIQTKENEPLWEPPDLSDEHLLNLADQLIKVDWKKSFEKFLKIRQKRLSMNQSECILNTQVQSDTINQTG